MNRTLFDCGVRKSVELKNGSLLDITSTMKKTAMLTKSYDVQCSCCGKAFNGQQYLDSHMKFKHPSSTAENSHEGQQHRDISPNQKEADVPCSVLDDSPPEAPYDPIIVNEESLGKKRRGSEKRKSYTVEFKKKTLDFLDSLTSSKNKYKIVSREKGVHRTLVQKWDKNRGQIFKELELNKRCKNSGNIRDARQRRKMVSEKPKHHERYPLTAKLLIAEFKVRRAAGCKVTKLWLRKKMKSKIEMCYGKSEADKFKGSNNWFQRFKKRHGLALRRRTNKKKNSADDGREIIQKFHKNLRKSLKTHRRRNKSSIDPKYGRWTPGNRYNVDQVPLPFVVDQGTTYDTVGNKQVWVSQPSSGLDKRQATLQLCIRAEGDQNVKPALVFRGKGNISSAEKDSYDERVDVYFQQNAWIDAEVNMQWCRKTLFPGVGNTEQEKVIFADNVSFQQSKEFHEACRNEINATVYMLPENHTDKIQPIDAGCGRMMKVKISCAMDRWLETEENLDKWHDKLSAKDRWILMTRWTGEAWSELKENKGFLKRLFEKTGCLLTIDGSGDEFITPQGLKDYHF